MVPNRPSAFPQSVPEFVELLADLSETAFDALRSTVFGPDGFDPDHRRCVQLARDLSLDESSVQTMLGLLAFMYESVNPVGRRAATPDQLQGIVADLVSENDHRPTRERLLALLASSSHLDQTLRVRDTKGGFSPQARRFGIAVDLRSMPATGGDGIEGLVPLVQLRISTEQADGSRGLMVLQLDAKSLEDLDEAVRSARDRLDSLRAEPRFAGLLQG